MPSVIKALCLFSLGIQVQKGRAPVDLSHYDSLFISKENTAMCSPRKSGCIIEEYQKIPEDTAESTETEKSVGDGYGEGTLLRIKSANLKTACANLGFSILTNTGGL